MRTKRALLSLIITVLIFTPNFTFSQQAGSNGSIIPVSDTIRVLVVYAEIDYNTLPDPGGNVNNWGTNSQGKTVPPADADSLFNHTIPANGVLTGWISGLYQEASLSNYYVLGDYYPEVITLPESAISQVNIFGVDVLVDSLNVKEPLSNTLHTFHGLPLSSFDNYDLTVPMGVFKPKVPNGKIDILLVIWRNVKINDDYGCNQGFGLTLKSSSPIKNMLGIETAAWFTGCASAKSNVNIILGEYFHGMYGGNNWHTAGGAGDPTFLGTPSSYSLTGQSRSTMRFASGFDRWFMGWKHPASIHQISALNGSGMAEVATDLSIQNQGTDSIFLLRNFATFGDAIRIKLPHLENTTSLPQYLWLENRQMNTRFDEYLTHGCTDNIPPFIDGTPGIYAYLQIGREFNNGANVFNIAEGKDYLFPLSAEGHFDFTYRYDLFQPANGSICGNWGNANIPIDKATSLPNPLTGNSDLYNPFDMDNNGIVGDSGIGTLSEVVNGSVVHYAPFFGDGFDPFATVTGNTQLGIGTNPALVPVYTLSGNRTTYLNGISVEVIDNGATPGVVGIKIKWNDYDINNDVRWCGNIVLQNDVNDSTNNSSKINLITGNTIMVDQGTSAKFVDGIAQADGTFLFADPSILTLKNGTVTTIEAGSELLVTNGSSLHIEAGATVIIKGNGKITIDSAAYICVEPFATIVLQDAASELVVNNNAMIGINPLLNIVTSNCSKLCDIETLIVTGNGFMTHKNLADAGADQVTCPTVGANMLGGNPTALNTVGTGGFTYNWLPIGGLDNPNIANPTIISVLSAPSYYLTVTDTNGCIGKDTINIMPDPTAVNTLSTTNTVCTKVGSDDGTATINVACGNPLAYTYLWDDPLAQTTPTATGLAPGTYTVTITDPNGIVTVETATITAINASFLYDFINPIITSDTTWSSDLKIKGDVKVKEGVTLTIVDARIEFSYDTIMDFGLPYGRARLTIENGGRANIRGATLTGCGGGIWDGIEVWGDALAPQVNSIQGNLFIGKNIKVVRQQQIITNSVIENAITGVQVFRSPLDNVFLPETGGGIITVNSVTFKNNRRAIYIKDYPNISANLITNNTFTYDNNTLFTYELPFDEMEFIRLENIKMAVNRLKNNSFFTDDTAFLTAERGVAIKLVNTKVFITFNTFNNLRTGIDAAAFNATTVLDIKTNTFNKCVKGTFIKGYLASVIKDNTFNVPALATDTTYGLYMLETSLYSIEENTFNGNLNQTVGVYINNTDPLNNAIINDVYKNNFNNLGFASFGNGENSNFLVSSKGLTFKCNTYTNNNLAIVTTVAPGISTAQGAPGATDKPAGNNFVSPCVFADGQLLNLANLGTPTNAYDYFHHTDASYIPNTGCFTATPFLQVDPMDAQINFSSDTTTGSCVARAQGPSGNIIAALTTEIAANQNAIKVIGVSLDGGNTNQFIATIEQKTINGAQLRTLLNSNKPLSSKVLNAVAKSNYNSKTIQRILRPSSPLNDAVLVSLLTRDTPVKSKKLKKILRKNLPAHWQIVDLIAAPNNGLSNQHRNQLLSKQAQKIANGNFLTLSETQVIEAEITGLEQEIGILKGRRIRAFLRDTTLTDNVITDSVINVLDSAKIGLAAQTISIEMLCNTGRFTEAIQKITVLEQQGLALAFCSFQRALISMESMPNKYMEIKTDPALRAQVAAVAANPTLTGSINARNLLAMAFNEPVNEVFDFPTITAARINNQEPEDTARITFSKTISNQSPLWGLWAYPNPFNQSTTIQAVLPENSNNAYLIIHDLTGREMYRSELNGGMNKQTIGTNILQKGIYIYHIKAEGIIQITRKLVKMK